MSRDESEATLLEVRAIGETGGSARGHWLDRLYLSVVGRGALFRDGWGDAKSIDRAAEFAAGSLARDTPAAAIDWQGDDSRGGLRLRYGSFTSPYPFDPGETQRADVCLVLPEAHRDVDELPVCIHLAGTGDEGFERRLTLAAPLARRNVASLLLENPMYGSRRPRDQRGPHVGTVARFMAMFAAAVEEARALVRWTVSLGVDAIVTGISMGGQAAAFVGATTKAEIGIVPCLGPSCIARQYAAGRLGQSCAWPALVSGSTREAAKAKLESTLRAGDVRQFGPPRRPDAAILVNASDDGYIPASVARALHQHWPGAELRWVPGGHISAYLLRRRAFVTAVSDSISRLRGRPVPGGTQSRAGQ